MTREELIALVESSTTVELGVPSSGTEGTMFTGAWCDECRKEQNYNPATGKGGCLLILKEMCDEPTGRWVRVPDGELEGELVCRDFIDRHSPKPKSPYRCKGTIDMFPEA